MSTDSGPAAGTTLIKKIKNRDGVIMLELVFSISILMAIFLAAFTFSFLYDDYYGVQKVAAEGAREASITRDIAWAKTKAAQAAWLWGLEPARTEVEFYVGSNDVICSVHYVARPFDKAFPRMLEGNTLQDFNMRTSARYAWSDTR
ncbi:MAG: TadE/TadG family type IV pilus assembly protein [Bacillota bacterium]